MGNYTTHSLCPKCGHNAYYVRTINRELWRFHEQSKQFECEESEYEEDVEDSEPVCAECGEPWPMDLD